MAKSHPFAFLDENVRVGFGMDPDDKLNKANCLQPTEYKLSIINNQLSMNTSNCFCIPI